MDTKSKRKVTVFERKWNPQTRKYDTAPLHEGFFHCWGLDVEEGDSGFASYSVGIIELPDGTVITPAAQLIKFNDNQPTE